MKKIAALILSALLALTAFGGVFAAGGELPFELVPPANTFANWLEGDDSPTTMSFAYSLSNEMAQFFQDYENAANEGTLDAFLASYPFDELWMTIQIDWAIDDVNDSVSGWHYTEYWNDHGNGVGYDQDYNWRCSEWDVVDCGLNNAAETVQKTWILRAVPDGERWTGNPETGTPGVKDQLREDQYDYHDDNVYIDFNEHTAYFRARFVVITRSFSDEITDKYYYSEWSEPCASGKDAEKTEPLKSGDIDAPVITGLHMTDETFNDNPVVAFTLTVPEKLQTQLASVSAAGGMIVIETEARVKGDEEWTQMANTDWTVKPGEMECALLHLVNDERPTIEEGTEIELRCRYRCSQPELDDIYSDYSNVIGFGTDNIGAGNTTPTDANVEIIQPEKKSCPICRFCPQPLGICIFIWLLILIVITVVIIIIAKKGKKKNK